MSEEDENSLINRLDRATFGNPMYMDGLVRKLFLEAIDRIEYLELQEGGLRADVQELDDENTAIKKSLDEHLPTVIYGLNVYIQELMYTTERETRTPMQIGLMAAHSSAHWIAKDVAQGGGEPLYDLPSVIDLMEALKKERTDNRVKEIWDQGYEACRMGLQKFRNPFNPRKPKDS